MKPDNGNNHACSVGGGIFKEGIICKSSISPFQALAQHVLTQLASPSRHPESMTKDLCPGVSRKGM